jgi:hypothetical protein
LRRSYPPLYLPHLRERATSLAFRATFEDRLGEVVGRVHRLNAATRELGNCNALKQLVSTATQLIPKVPTAMAAAASAAGVAAPVAGGGTVSPLDGSSSSNSSSSSGHHPPLFLLLHWAAILSCRVQGVPMRDPRGTLLHVLAAVASAGGYKQHAVTVANLMWADVGAGNAEGSELL